MQPADGELFARQPRIRDQIVAEMDEGARQGIDGIVLEASLYHRDWGFELGSVSRPTRVWHGGRDRQAAVAWARHLAQGIPGASMTMVVNGGHFSTLVDHAEGILASVSGAGR
jgi:pimeloyl-ACP methyl ester carboxylesterase